MQEKEAFLARKQREGIVLNVVQTEAVLHTDGPMLLLASPGSGKTTTIVMKIGYLIVEKKADPSRIKAITFSRASAADMRDRFARLCPELPVRGVDFSTIHSLAFAVTREHLRNERTDFQIIEGDVDLESREEAPMGMPALHKKLILRELYKTIAGEHIADDQMDELTTYISFVKNKLLPPDQWERVPCSVPKAAHIARQYEQFKRSGTDKLLLDYDDMLTVAHEAFSRDRKLLQRYQSRYDYILTDESQDTSLVQHEIIGKLAQPHRNLCVVADDDQSIYTWRAAEPDYLLQFKQVYPDAKLLKMEQNYRSSRNIVEVANRFIKQNKQRYDKQMFTANQPQRPIAITEVAEYEDQAKRVAESVSAIANLRDTAVLYRNNSSSIALMNEFDRAGIPFFIRDGDSRFFSHWVVEDVLNFMRMAFTDRRPDLLEKIHLKFNGYISKQQMAALKDIHNGESVFDNLLRHVPLQDYQISLLQESKDTFARMKEMTPQAAIRVIRTKLGYDKAVEKTCERLGFRKEYIVGILNTLDNIADGLATLPDFAARLKQLEAIMASSKRNRGANAVTFSTFHSAKGLEFEHVFMIDLVEGIIPSQEDIRSYDKGETAEMEEAVRLFYVGMTRAKSNLELLSYRERGGEKAKRSRFVSYVEKLQPAPAASSAQAASVSVPQAGTAPMLPNAIRTWSGIGAGTKVKHSSFGPGEIVSLDEEAVEIQFAGERKRLSASTCLSRGLLALAEEAVPSRG